MILVLNCGSQSIKYKVFNGALKLLKEKKIAVDNQLNYRQILVEELNKLKVFYGRMDLIGHRMVHGGEKFREPAVVTSSVLKELQRYSKLAPLHNPFNILGIKTSSEIFPKTKQATVFDTGFYKDLKEYAFIYPLPESIRKTYGFRRFGFHGISHRYAMEAAAEKLGRPLGKIKIITCHLGGGSSVTAIKNGRAVDTSMGFTPLEGLTMMTRCGDLDPGVILELARTVSVRKTDQILNHESGLKGICGMDDMKKILEAAAKGSAKAKLALKVFTYRIQKYIGAYFAVLGGCDALVFTGSIGAGSLKIRRLICRDLTILKKPFQVKIMAVEPNEELAIAKEIQKL